MTPEQIDRLKPEKLHTELLRAYETISVLQKHNNKLSDRTNELRRQKDEWMQRCERLKASNRMLLQMVDE